jgi:phosphoglycolate phosphatase-like HAD superfamily hydrolase
MLFCIDSDGCVFDNMRWKHEHAFLPAFVEVWGLGQWQELVAEHWYKINLYSQTRGINRFAAFAKCLRKLQQTGDPSLGHCLPVDLDVFEHLIANPANRNAGAIRAEANRVPDSKVFVQALRWSDQVNEWVKGIDVAHQAFTNARTALRHMAALGEVHVVSQAPHATLQEEWEQAGLAGLTTRILGQEFGSKSEQVFVARNGRDLPTLLVGDAPSDEHAANAADCLFFPIIPQQEDASWATMTRILEDQVNLTLTNPDSFKHALAEFHKLLGD